MTLPEFVERVVAESSTYDETAKTFVDLSTGQTVHEVEYCARVQADYSLMVPLAVLEAANKDEARG